MQEKIDRFNALERNPTFLRLQKFIVPNNRKIQKVFLPLWITIVLFAVAGPFVYSSDRSTYFGFWYENGVYLGQFSAVCYAFTLIPGILRRTRLLPLTRTLLMLFRRQMGVTMYLSAVSHSMIVRYIPIAMTTGDFFTPPPLFMFFGFLTLLLLLPLWITSNDSSVKKLGKNWHILHKLTYIALFTIFLHVALQGQSWISLFVGGIMAVEVASWFLPYLFPASQKPATPATPSAPQS